MAANRALRCRSSSRKGRRTPSRFRPTAANRRVISGWAATTARPRTLRLPPPALQFFRRGGKRRSSVPSHANLADCRWCPRRPLLSAGQSGSEQNLRAATLREDRRSRDGWAGPIGGWFAHQPGNAVRSQSRPTLPARRRPGARCGCGRPDVTFTPSAIGPAHRPRAGSSARGGEELPLAGETLQIGEEKSYLYPLRQDWSIGPLWSRRLRLHVGESLASSYASLGFSAPRWRAEERQDDILSLEPPHGGKGRQANAFPMRHARWCCGWLLWVGERCRPARQRHWRD